MKYGEQIFIINIGMHDPLFMCVICGETDDDGPLRHKDGCKEIRMMALALSDGDTNHNESFQL
jgi:hypothetical protein